MDPSRDRRVVADQRAQIIDGTVAALTEDRPPVAERLLVDVVLTPLARHCRGKQHTGSVGGQRSDELRSLGRRQVLGDLEALHQIELPAEIDRC